MGKEREQPSLAFHLSAGGIFGPQKPTIFDTDEGIAKCMTIMIAKLNSFIFIFLIEFNDPFWPSMKIIYVCICHVVVGR